MTSVFPDTRGVACRACGAVRAPAGKHGVCGTCYNSYCYYAMRVHGFSKPVEYDETVFNEWLAARLVRALSRAEKNGIAVRCEAISGPQTKNFGFQCGAFATMERDGRKVCMNHGTRATHVAYVDGNSAKDWYQIMRGQIKRLAAADEKFAQAVRDAIKCT